MSFSFAHSLVGLPSLSLAAENDWSLSVEVSVSGRYEKQDFISPEAKQQVKNKGMVEDSTLGQYSHPADHNHRAGERTEVTKEEDEHVVNPSDSVSVETNCSKVPDEETLLMKTLELSPTNTGVKGLCGAAADWRGEAVSTAVKLEAEPSWSEALRTPLLAISRNEYVSNSRLTNTNSQHTEGEAVELGLLVL